MNDRIQRLRDHVNYKHLDGDVCLRCWAADEIERLLAERDDLQERLQVRSMELAQARQGRALLELERVQAENAQLRRQLFAERGITPEIDVRHETAAEIVADLHRSIDRIDALLAARNPHLTNALLDGDRDE